MLKIKIDPYFVGSVKRGSGSVDVLPYQHGCIFLFLKIRCNQFVTFYLMLDVVDASLRKHCKNENLECIVTISM